MLLSEISDLTFDWIGASFGIPSADFVDASISDNGVAGTSSFPSTLFCCVTGTAAASISWIMGMLASKKMLTDKITDWKIER